MDMKVIILLFIIFLLNKITNLIDILINIYGKECVENGFLFLLFGLENYVLIVFFKKKDNKILICTNYILQQNKIGC
jgi:hypothetical protein